MGKSARAKNITAVPAPGRDEHGSGDPVASGAPDTLYQAFEGLGLTPYQARVQVALLRSGPAACIDLARTAGIPRTSIYQVLEELDAKGLGYRLPGKGPARWSSVGRDAVLACLVGQEEERLSQLRARSAQVRDMLDELLPGDRPSAPVPYVHQVHDPSRVTRLYDELLTRTEHELLVFNRPPYFAKVGTPKPTILETVGRVPARVLYQTEQVEAADEAWHREIAAYHEAGVEGRVVPELPIKLAIFDRRNTLLSIDGAAMPRRATPTTLFVEHPGYAFVHVEAFECLWEGATPFETVRDGVAGADPATV